MNSIGIIRKVDHLGRIVLPKELREKLNIQPQDGVEIFVGDSHIVLKRYNPSCVICGSIEQLFYFREKIICEDCVNETSKYATTSTE